MNDPKSAPSRSIAAIVTLVALSTAIGALAVFQWMELFVIHAGGQAICGVNAVVNCATVWNTPFAQSLHHALKMPVAGLGVIWAVVAESMSVWLLLRVQRGKSATGAVAAVRAVAVVGLLACALFAVDHFRSGAVCLTCLGTYLLTLAFAHVAFRLFRESWVPPAGQRLTPLLPPLAVAVLAYGLLLYPGSQTPTGTPHRLARPPDSTAPTTEPPAAASSDSPLSRYLGSLSPMERQALSDSLASYRVSAPAAGTERLPIRLRLGSSQAPVKVVEFTDIRCSHCKVLEETMADLRRLLPRESFSVEPRHFPLDRECNPVVGGSDGTAIRCIGAKAQICLETAPDFLALREKLFENQAQLTPEKILEIGSSGSVKRAELEACIAKRETGDRLAQDIQYAMLYSPQGTPLVVVNGRKASPSGPFLYALALAGGNADAPEFKSLPRGTPGP
jgi:protein-disulfide isomerase/uncharacterized membrane protein